MAQRINDGRGQGAGAGSTTKLASSLATGARMGPSFIHTGYVHTYGEGHGAGNGLTAPYGFGHGYGAGKGRTNGYDYCPEPEEE